MSQKQEVDNLGRNTALYLVAQIVSKIASFILLPLYTNYISPSDLGIYEYIRSYTAIISILSAMGLSTFYLRFYASEKDKKLFTGSVFWFLTIWNVALFCLELIFVPIIMRVLNAPCNFFPYMFLALIHQLLFSVETIPMRTYRIKGEAMKYLAISSLKAVLQIGFIIVFLRVFHWGVFGRYTAEIIIACIFAVVFILYIAKNSRNAVDFTIVKRGLKFSIPLVPTELLQIGSTSLCAILIEKMLSVVQLGLYSVSLSISAVINTITTSLWYAVEPDLYIKSDDANFSYFFVKLKRIYMAVTALVCVGCGLFIKEAVLLLLNEKYQETWTIVQVLAFSYIMGGLTTLYNQIAIIQNKTKKLIWVNLSKLVGSVGACVILVPIFHIHALGWSYFAGYVISFLLSYILIDKDKEREKTLWEDYTVIILSAFIIFMTRMFSDAFSCVEIFIKIAVFCGYAVIVLLIYKVDIKDIMAMVMKKQK